MSLFSLFSRKKPKPVFSTEDHPQPLRADICEGQRWIVFDLCRYSEVYEALEVQINEISMSGNYIKLHDRGWVPFTDVKFVERIRDCA